MEHILKQALLSIDVRYIRVVSVKKQSHCKERDLSNEYEQVGEMN